jgi:hypothetical protein
MLTFEILQVDTKSSSQSNLLLFGITFPVVTSKSWLFLQQPNVTTSLEQILSKLMAATFELNLFSGRWKGD